jgi:hypothetical protein
MKELIVEANYTEFRNRYEKGRPFALISAFQGDLDYSSNKKNNIFLRSKIKEQGYDQIRIQGHYQEDDQFHECMLVFCDGDYKEFVRFLIFFGKRYFQNSVIVVDPDSNIWEYATKANSTIGGIGSKKRYDKFLNASNLELDAIITKFSRRTYELDYIRIVQD